VDVQVRRARAIHGASMMEAGALLPFSTTFAQHGAGSGSAAGSRPGTAGSGRPGTGRSGGNGGGAGSRPGTGLSGGRSSAMGGAGRNSPSSAAEESVE
jgi:hypothetical protein